MNSEFVPPFSSAVASRYDEFRVMPASVIDTIVERIAAAAGLEAEAQILELGCGTGRIGRPFLQRGYRYAGVDASVEMLKHFLEGAKGFDPPVLMLASGTHLPFAVSSVDLVLAIQVLGIIPGWRHAIAELRRVLRPGGHIAVGRVEHEPESLHNFVRGERTRLLRSWEIATDRPGGGEAQVLAALASELDQIESAEIVTWQSELQPGLAVEANVSGWRVQALAPELQQRLREQLSHSVISRYGSITAPIIDVSRFTLTLFP
ncbi:MAG: class I SAM-dependent methyltransferase [Dehalococcoidia bacterium]